MVVIANHKQWIFGTLKIQSQKATALMLQMVNATTQITSTKTAMEKDNKIRLFVAASCASCNEVSQLLREGKVNITPDEVIDLEEHIEWAEKLHFTRGVPAAFQGSQQCQLGVQGNDESRQLMIKCPK